MGICAAKVELFTLELFKKLNVTGISTTLETLTFLKTAAELGCRIWLRHVVVPGINDTQEAIEKLFRVIQPFDTAIEKVELLDYHRLGVEKYQNAGIPYPLKNKPGLAPERLKMLQNLLEDLLKNGILYNRQQKYLEFD